ncbi:MAG: hypothetical protein CSA60_03890 [Neptuniibacter caesariensis]|uniref:Uncharacterized protein n=1 Tax=Neptuniibacter caesariensis TaxID=207954 RepID=A0A2G6JNC5_NEPCE|nr:MAG: hypothetical protein CSA60_03890 [Neptuniibacter caesariensis]
MAAVDEQNRYNLRMMSKTFDGYREVSHTQNSAVARLRKEDESYTLMDFGRGAVVIEMPSGYSVLEIPNFEGVDSEFKYNYKAQKLSGVNAAADYFNNKVYKYLQSGPALGSDHAWSTQVNISDIAPKGINGGKVTIDLERSYFNHNNKEYVLITYNIPAFQAIDNDGDFIIHWGEGAALADPGFGEIYWNAAVQRSVVEETTGIRRPYRYNTYEPSQVNRQK